MSVQQLVPPAVATSRVAEARAAVDAAASVPVGLLDAEELSMMLSALAALESQTAALKLCVLAEAERRQVAEQAADTGTDAWAAQLTGTTAAVMAGGIWLAGRLEETYHATAEAFAAGGITEDQARIIVRAGDRLPAQVSDEQRGNAEEALVAKAVEGMDPRRLRHAARRMLEVVSAELADAHEAGLLDAEEQRARNETSLVLHDNGDGTCTGRFTIPELHAQLLRTALERLSAPRRRYRRDEDGRFRDQDGEPAGSGQSWTDRLGAAFCELLEHLPRDGHGPNGATLLVTIGLDQLRDGLGSGQLDTGVRISPGQARRLACDASIVPVVLGGDSRPLDVGRERRLHTKAQRQALSLQYDACAAVGCHRPFAWCEVHHRKPWSHGGTTDLANAVPLCGWHHQRAHDTAYCVTYRPDGDVRFRLADPGRRGSRTPRLVG